MSHFTEFEAGLYLAILGAIFVAVAWLSASLVIGLVLIGTHVLTGAVMQRRLYLNGDF